MINPMNRHTPMRMMGLSSGMDTDFIIQQTLRLHQFRIDNRVRDRTILEWRQETHNSLRDEINNLTRTFMSNLGSNPLVNRQTFNSTVANISGTNSGAVSVRTLTGTPTGSITINRVESLARGASVTSGRSVSAGGAGFNPNHRLDSLQFAGANPNDPAQTIQFTATTSDGRISLDDVRNAVWDDPLNPEIVSFNLPGQSEESTVNPQVRRYNDGAIVITYGGRELARIPSGEDEASFRFEFPPPPINPDPTDPDTADRQWFILHRDEDGNVTVSEDRPAPDPNDPDYGEDAEEPFSLNLSTLRFMQTATVNVRNEAGAITGQTQITRWANATNNDNIRLVDSTDPDNLMGGERLEFTTTLNINVSTDPDNPVEPITLRASDSISDMIRAVNRGGTGVTMSYNRLTDRFTIEHNQINSTLDQLNIAEGDGNLLNLLGLAGPVDPRTHQQGSQAVVYINDERFYSDSNVISFRGLSITLNETTDDAMTVSFTRDAERPLAAIREFIDAYNTLVQRLETLTTERQSRSQRSYRPLTDEEKQNMTERQVDEWQRIARIGIMRNDTALERLTMNIRREFFNAIEGTGMSASQIGLTTGHSSGGTGGQIIIDEPRLIAALERDPDMVADIFARIENDPETGSPRGVGLIHNLNSHFTTFVNTSQVNSLSSLEDSLRRTNEQIERMQARMFAEEDRLFRQFAAMETAMSNLNNQGQWFASMLGSM